MVSVRNSDENVVFLDLSGSVSSLSLENCQKGGSICQVVYTYIHFDKPIWM